MEEGNAVETLLDWLNTNHYAWIGSQLGLLVALVIYFLWSRRDGSHHYRMRRVEVPLPSDVEDVGHAVEAGPERGADVAWKRTGASGDAPGDAETPRFHFRFDGDACNGRALVRDRKVRLIFAQGMATTLLQSISFKGRKFLALLGKEAQLAITIWPGEGLDLRGPPMAVARFKDARLVEEVAFELYVREDCPDEVPVTAEFFTGDKRLYGLKFSTRVQSPDGQPGAATPSLPPTEIDLDMAAALQKSGKGEAGGGDLLLKLDLVGGGLLMNLIHTSGEAGMVSVGSAFIDNLDKSSLQAQLAQVRSELGAAFYASAVWDRSTLPPLNATDTDDLADCFERVASAGSILNRVLRATADAVRLFDYIEAQPPGTRLTIATSKVFLPFEILYPHRFSKDWPPEERRRSPVSRRAFWGAKFALEVSYAAAGNYMALVQTHRRAPREVSLNLNETIPGTGSPTPMEIHGTLESDLKSRGVACDSNRRCAEMKQVLLGARTGANLVYVYCHGSAADATAGSLEQLELNDDPCVVRPVGMYGSGYTNAPIIFLNACYSGATSPLFFTGFLESFRDQGALGLIATSFPVPVMFGARFGADVVTECMFGTDSLGERLRRLRLAHAEQGNPVPLFYSVQCQLGR